MKILVVGGRGTIGQAVVQELAQRHTVIVAGRSGPEVVDMADAASIEALMKRVGQIDAIVSAAGNIHFGPLLEMTDEQLYIGIKDKLMGQVNLALAGARYLTDRGSVTLTTGILSQDPVPYSVSAAMVNAGIEGFVKAAALEMPRGIRINAVSPTILTESLAAYGSYMRGFESVPAVRVGRAFSKSVEGAHTGRVFEAI